MVVYFPKNGKSVIINGIQIKRPGLPMQFPVKVYERWVEKGLLVKTPQEMDPLSPEELAKQVEDANAAGKPVFAPRPLEAPIPMGSPDPITMPLTESAGSEGGLKLAGIGDDYPTSSSVETAPMNEYDAMLLDAVNKELAKKGKSAVSISELEKNAEQNKTEAVKVEEVSQPQIQESLVEEEVVEQKGIFAEISSEATEELTYEKALSMIKRNEDGSLKVGKDGLYVLTAGAKPWKKTEICAVIENHKK